MMVNNYDGDLLDARSTGCGLSQPQEVRPSGLSQPQQPQEVRPSGSR